MESLDGKLIIYVPARVAQKMATFSQEKKNNQQLKRGKRLYFNYDRNKLHDNFTALCGNCDFIYVSFQRLKKNSRGLKSRWHAWREKA